MGRWKFEFETIDPDDTEKKWVVGVSEARYKRIRDAGHEKEHARLVLVHDVLKSPIAIYRGWNRMAQDEGLIYVGKPDFDYHRIQPAIIVPAPPGMAFLVFVLPGGEIDSWGWRKHAEGNPSSPEGIIGSVIWQRQDPN